MRRSAARPPGGGVRSGERAQTRQNGGSMSFSHGSAVPAKAVEAHLPAAVDVARFRQRGDGVAAGLGAGDG